MVTAFVGDDLRGQSGYRPPAPRASPEAPARFSKVLTVGTLLRNPSTPQGAPPFVLLKRDGSLRCLVTPIAGVDLMPHIGARVGIRGRGQHLPLTGALHVRADRVTPLATDPSDWRGAAALTHTGGRENAGRNASRQILATPNSDRAKTDSGRPKLDSGGPKHDSGRSELATAEPDTVDDVGGVRLAGAVGRADQVVPELLPAVEEQSLLAAEPAPACGPDCGLETCQCTCRDQRCRLGPCGSPGRHWVRSEYMRWWADGMHVPALVTTSPEGTDGADAGVLGVGDTTILFGNTRLHDESRNGARIRVGSWLGPGDCVGLEGEYFMIGEDSVRFRAGSDAAGRPILARPFFNINPRVDGTGAFDPPARQDAQLVAFPEVLAGSVTVHSTSELDSAGLHLRWNYHCCDSSCHDPCDGHPLAVHRARLDFLLGYRYLKLDETVAVREDLTSLDPDNSGQFDILDQFAARNHFHGVEIGALWELEHRRWFIEVLSKLALGNNHQVVHIDGTTVATPTGGPSTSAPGGLLAQRTNVGRHARDDFAVVPELGLTIGYRITERLRLSGGYTFVYWNRIVRPGDAIDLDVNPDLLPPEQSPLAGALRPAFAFADTDFWVQGVSCGLDYRW